MPALEAKKNIYWVGVLDKELRNFDIIMHTDYGTTYNSYLVRGSEKTVLFDTVKEPFFEEHLEHIRQVCDPSEIDYIVVNHTEPDHSGSILKLLEYAPNAKVVAGKVALNYLSEIFNAPFPSIMVTEKDTLDIGGMTLQFISAPMLHWPDSTYTYIPQAKALFTCDSFGCHFADERVFNDLIDTDFSESYQYYYDNIIGPYAHPSMANALKKIEPLEIELIANGHGPVLRKDIPHYIELYHKWSAPVVRENKQVVIAYASCYGYTKMLAEKIAEGIRHAGIDNLKVLDLETTDLEEAGKQLQQADGFLLGSPTLVADALPPVWQMLTYINPIIQKGRFAGAFGSYAWGGEAVPNLLHRMEKLNLKLPVEGYRVKLKPSDEQLQEAFVYGENFAKAMLE